MSTSPHNIDPVGSPAFYILLALAEGPAHGAEIQSQIVGDTVGAVYVKKSTLYDELKRLQEAGLIEVLDVRGREKTFNLTRDGQALVVREGRALDFFADKIKLRLGRLL